MQTYGDLPTSPVNTKITYTADTGNGTSNFNTAGFVVLEIICDWTDKDTNTPALYTAYTGNANYLLTNAEQEETPGGLAKITLTYTASSTGTPPTSYSEQTSQTEIPIQRHPDFADWADDWDDDEQAFKPGTTKEGIVSYIVGTSTVTKTEYFTDKPSHRLGDVGKLQTPGGDYSDSGLYLIIGANRSLQGKFWTVVTVYQYSAEAWDTDIYKAA